MTFEMPLAATLPLSGDLHARSDYQEVLADIPRHGHWRRTRIPAAAITGALAVLASGAYSGHMLPALGAAGLIFDIGGAGVFATGLILSPREVREMGTSRFNGNEIPRAYWAEVQRDLWVGLTFLGLGFAAQAIAGALATH